MFDNRRQFHYHTQGGSTAPAVRTCAYLRNRVANLEHLSSF